MMRESNTMKARTTRTLPKRHARRVGTSTPDQIVTTRKSYYAMR
jgi:hypothetical protein